MNPTNKIMLSNIVTFGKHKGKTWKDAIEDDPKWVAWARSNVSWVNLDEKSEEYLYKKLSTRMGGNYDDYNNNPFEDDIDDGEYTAYLDSGIW